jgi:hypothetical protein
MIAGMMFFTNPSEKSLKIFTYGTMIMEAFKANQNNKFGAKTGFSAILMNGLVGNITQELIDDTHIKHTNYLLFSIGEITNIKDSVSSKSEATFIGIFGHWLLLRKYKYKGVHKANKD